MPGRIEARFADLAEAGRAGLVTYLCAGDPDIETSTRIIEGLPEAGADIIEIGMPFHRSDGRWPLDPGRSAQGAWRRA